MASQSSRSGLLWIFLQLTLFAAALFFLIPVPASDINHPPNRILPVLLSISFFSLSRLIASFRGGGNAIYNGAEVAVFIGYACIMYLVGRFLV